MDRKNSILIIASLDKSANEERANAVVSLLTKKGYIVNIFNTNFHFSHMLRLKFFLCSKRFFLKYLFYLFLFKVQIRKFYPLVEEMQIRADYILYYFTKNNYNIVVCQNSQDIIALLKLKGAKTVYDAPSVFSELIKCNLVNEKQFEQIRNIERLVFQKVDALTFQWPIYFNIANNINLPIKNPFFANFGCATKNIHANFIYPPKIVYVGNLNSRWVNPDLLLDLTQISQYKIDIYGYEEPKNMALKKFYLGYLDDTDKLCKYQFGLISTFPDVPNFSAKQMLYFSYGLPVLSPSWSKDKILESGVIYFSKTNFNEVINKYSSQEAWLKKQKSGLVIANKFEWSKTLKSYDSTIQNLSLIKKQ
jgi:hypothetical protein